MSIDGSHVPRSKSALVIVCNLCLLNKSHMHLEILKYVGRYIHQVEVIYHTQNPKVRVTL